VASQPKSLPDEEDADIDEEDADIDEEDADMAHAIMASFQPSPVASLQSSPVPSHGLSGATDTEEELMGHAFALSNESLQEDQCRRGMEGRTMGESPVISSQHNDVDAVRVLSLETKEQENRKRAEARQRTLEKCNGIADFQQQFLNSWFLTWMVATGKAHVLEGLSLKQKRALIRILQEEIKLKKWHGNLPRGYFEHLASLGESLEETAETLAVVVSRMAGPLPVLQQYMHAEDAPDCAVSYTHLTLPTNLRVRMQVIADFV